MGEIEKKGKSHARSISNERGQSLIQAMVSIAITGILMMSILGILNYQNRETRALSEKLAVTDLEKTLTSSMADGSVCQYLMTRPGVQPINVNALVGANGPQIIPVPLTGAPPKANLYTSVNTSVTPAVPGPIIAQVGQAPSAFSSNLVANAIQLSVHPLTAAPPGYPANLTADWLVEFDSTKLVRPLKPAATSTILTVNAAGAVISCQGDSAHLTQPHYTLWFDQTSNSRTSPSNFTKSARGTFPSYGDIILHTGEAYSWSNMIPGLQSGLFEMKIYAPQAITVTQLVTFVDDNVYFWLNGANIDSVTGFNGYSKTISWNLIQGLNTIDIVLNNSVGGFCSLILVGDFFDRYPQLRYVPL